MRLGGLGVLNPTETADAAYSTSKAATAHLTKAIRGEAPFELAAHRSTMRDARAQYKKEKRSHFEERTKEVISELPTTQAKAAKRAAEYKNGQWLNMKCSAANGTILSRREWRDGWAVRYGK